MRDFAGVCLVILNKDTGILIQVIQEYWNKTGSKCRMNQEEGGGSEDKMWEGMEKKITEKNVEGKKGCKEQDQEVDWEQKYKGLWKKENSTGNK